MPGLAACAVPVSQSSICHASCIRPLPCPARPGPPAARRASTAGGAGEDGSGDHRRPAGQQCAGAGLREEGGRLEGGWAKEHIMTAGGAAWRHACMLMRRWVGAPPLSPRPGREASPHRMHARTGHGSWQRMAQRARVHPPPSPPARRHLCAPPTAATTRRPAAAPPRSAHHCHIGDQVRACAGGDQRAVEGAGPGHGGEDGIEHRLGGEVQAPEGGGGGREGGGAGRSSATRTQDSNRACTHTQGRNDDGAAARVRAAAARPPCGGCI